MGCDIVVLVLDAPTSTDFLGLRTKLVLYSFRRSGGPGEIFDADPVTRDETGGRTRDGIVTIGRVRPTRGGGRAGAGRMWDVDVFVCTYYNYKHAACKHGSHIGNV